MPSSSGAAMQNPENRSTDPTPLKDPSGYVNQTSKVRGGFGSRLPFKDVAILAGVSGVTYAGANYIYHKVVPKSKDPNAIKAFKPMKLFQGGLMQTGASVAAYYTADGIAQVAPSAINPMYVRPLMTGVYKTGLTMAFKKKPTLWGGVTDFVLSAGSDYVGPGIAHVGYGLAHDAWSGKLL